MRAHMLVLPACVLLAPFAASAAIPEPYIVDARLSGVSMIADAPYGTLQTALRSGDALALRVDVHSSHNPAPSLVADLSVFGGPSAENIPPLSPDGSHFGYNFIDYYPSYAYDIGPFSLAGIPDGTLAIPLTATDANGAVSSLTSHVVVDSASPVAALTNLYFSASPPQQGDMMYLSGRIDGTGSAGRAYHLDETLLDANGNVLPGAFQGVHVEYDGVAINAALASDGSFADVPVTLYEGGDIGQISRAASFKFVMTVYDEAGNTSSASITVPVPHAPSAPKVSSVLFLPGTEASRLYMRSPDGQERELWEPTFSPDIAMLAMNPDGTSVNDVYTKDIIGSFYGNDGVRGALMQTLFGEDAMVYGDFEHFMDALVASTTLGMKEWRAYPYDWRYDVRDVVRDGAPTEMPDGVVKRVYLEDVLDEMAAHSATGKVTIVGHSNGGLLAKALMEKLLEDGKTGEVDQIVLLATPQWGTPADIGAMLHADNFAGMPNFIVNKVEARDAERYMGDAYDLLPSRAYFTHVADPAVSFAEDGALSGQFADAFGPSVDSFTSLDNFLADSAGLDAQTGSASDLRALVPLSGDFLSKADATHAALDAWTPPAGVKVTAIAGWGQDTVKGLAYTTSSRVVCKNGACSDALALSHTPITTQDGDGTVVSPSAIGDTGEGWYFDTSAFAADGNQTYSHQNLTSATPTQVVLADLLEGKSPDLESYIVSTKPPSENNIKLRISSHSPVNLLVTDSSGRQSGVVPISNTDFSGVKQDIPGSSVFVFDDEEYVSVPQGGAYQVTANGYTDGPTMLQVEQMDANGTATTTALFASIPTTASTTMNFSVADGISSTPQVDTNGDGTPDLAPVSISSATDPLAYLAYMKTAIGGMALEKHITRELDAKLANIEHLVKRDNIWDDADEDGRDRPRRGERLDERIAKRIDLLRSYVERQVAKNARQESKTHPPSTQVGISGDDGALILDMISVLKTLSV